MTETQPRPQPEKYAPEGIVISNYQYHKDKWSGIGGSYSWLIEHEVYGKGRMALAEREWNRSASSPYSRSLIEKDLIRRALIPLKNDYELDSKST